MVWIRFQHTKRWLQKKAGVGGLKLASNLAKNTYPRLGDKKEPHCLLYTPGVLHICELGEVIAHRPRSKFPEYYETDIFGKENEPRMYFELLSIKK